jgi:hypothetical protein
MMAEALNTITRPRNTNSRVTVNSHPSTLTRFAMGDQFHHGDRRTGRFFGGGFEKKSD